MSAIYVKYLDVRGKARFGGRDILERYCYDHTKIVEYEHNGQDFFATLRTESSESDERAQYLAEYQAGRLRSGLMAATVHDTIRDLVKAQAE